MGFIPASGYVRIETTSPGTVASGLVIATAKCPAGRIGVGGGYTAVSALNEVVLPDMKVQRATVLEDLSGYEVDASSALWGTTYKLKVIALCVIAQTG
jgi:hypothetical protein